jgi:hypothetical protein
VKPAGLKIRNSKSEIRNKSESRIPNDRNGKPAVSVIRVLDFGFAFAYLSVALAFPL